MSSAVLTLGALSIYKSALLIALGVAAAAALFYALYVSHGGLREAAWLYVALSLVLSVLLARTLHYYCHAEQYGSFAKAMTNYAVGSFCLPGAVLGLYLAAIAVEALGFTRNGERVLDCAAAPAALAFAFIRLSALYTSSCRSKIMVTTPLLQHLPLASAVTNGAGGTEYRFATFFVEFLLLALATAVLLRFFFRRRRHAMKAGEKRDGHVFLLFLLLYGAIELVLDSTRNDSSFFPFNGFVSVGQIAAAACILIPLVIYSVRSVRVNGLKPYHFLLWLLWLAALGVAGGAEYLVQRHGNWYLRCYAAMTLAGGMMSLVSYLFYLTVCDKRKRVKR